MAASNLQPERATRLADRLAAARRRRFVGRGDELALIRSALAATEPPFSVLYLHGPGGVGKTTLLGEYARIAAEAGLHTVKLDGRDIDPTPSGLLLALRRSLDLPGDDSPFEALAQPSRRLLLIDTYEMLAPLDRWLRETVLPQLPAACLVVIAGRTPPAPAWRADLEWAELTRVVSVNNLRPEESRGYLAARGIPGDQHADVLTFTHGHPLALALLADALGRGDSLAGFDPLRQPDVVRSLLEHLVREAPDARQRAALSVCALSLETTESLLAEVVGADEAPGLFAWLRQQSFIAEGPRGLYPHDLAREALEADLRWRDPEGCRQLANQIYRCLRAKVAVAGDAERQRLHLDTLYVIRTNPTNRPYFDWEAVEGLTAEPTTADDAQSIVDLVRTHEGEASARIAEYWLRRQPGAFLMFRAVEGEWFGFMAHLSLHEASGEDIAADPAVAAALRFAQRYGPARPGEAIVHLRFWMHRERYQDVTAAINLTAMNVVTQCVTNPSLAWNFVTMADPDFWLPHFTGVNFPRAAEADFEVGGRRYGVFAHDWRVESASAWLSGPRETPMAFATTRQGRPPMLTPSRAEFADAARQALRDFTRPDRLAANPLMRTRLVAAAADSLASPATLQSLIREAVAGLASAPRDLKFHRAVWHTYIEPAPTQEQAADLLSLPFNTYRYHLARGIERIVDWLWRREIAGPTG